MRPTSTSILWVIERSARVDRSTAQALATIFEAPHGRLAGRDLATGHAVTVVAVVLAEKPQSRIGEAK
jgi:hypothetical protein